MKKLFSTSILLLLVASITFAQSNTRVVSLSPAATFNLMELGCEKNIVGCTSFCDLADNEDLVVGSAISMNTEKLLSLKPNVVIYTTMFKPNQIKRIEQLGIKTQLFASPKNWNETCEQFIRLGALVGKKQEARAYTDSCNSIMDSIIQTIPKGNKPKIFIEIGAKPLFTAIPNTFMQDYIDIIGGINIAADQTIGSISREKVIMKNPDIIIIVTMGIVSAEEKQIWESYTDLSATKNNKILVVDASLSCRPTPHNFLNTIIKLNELIYNK